MTTKIETRPDGKLHVEYETGEVFDGDPLEVTQKISEAHQSTKKWAQESKRQAEEWKSKYEDASSVVPQNGGGAPPAPVVDQNESQLQSYLLTQTAKALGYSTADEYKADLQRVKKTTEELNNNLVASQFLAQNPDFPNTPEAIKALSEEIDAMGGNYSARAMENAHAAIIRRHAVDQTVGYAPLSIEEQNATWQNELQADNRRKAAPPMIQSKSPDAIQQGFNPWDSKAVPTEQLRAMAIRQQLEGK